MDMQAADLRQICPWVHSLSIFWDLFPAGLLRPLPGLLFLVGRFDSQISVVFYSGQQNYLFLETHKMIEFVQN